MPFYKYICLWSKTPCMQVFCILRGSSELTYEVLNQHCRPSSFREPLKVISYAATSKHKRMSISAAGLEAFRRVTPETGVRHRRGRLSPADLDWVYVCVRMCRSFSHILSYDLQAGGVTYIVWKKGEKKLELKSQPHSGISGHWSWHNQGYS